jgi:presenilin-like A22 family membrane protease
MQADFTEIGGGSEESVINPLIYISVILIATAIILFIGRRRKGRFLKYAFLGIICITMIYVFFPFLTMAIYADEFDEEWDLEKDLDQPISLIEVDNIDNDDALEIILGTETGLVIVNDGKTHQEEWRSNDLGSSVTKILVVDINGDRNQDLIVAAGRLYIFSRASADQSLSEVWQSDNNDYTSIGYGRLGNYSGYSIAACNNTNVLTIFNFNNLLFQNKSTHQMSQPIFDLVVDDIDNSGDDELAVLSTSRLQVLRANDFSSILNITQLNDLAGVMVENNYYRQSDQLILWDQTGRIHIYDYPSQSRLWYEDVGTHIGGIAVYDLYGVSKGKEMVVSVDGNIYIYYSEEDKTNYKYYWDFTDELGRLNSDANGVAIADLDRNGDEEVVAGHSQGYNTEEITGLDESLLNTPCFIAVVIAVILGILLFKYPEWYIVDFIGIVVAAGVCAIIGISLAVLPILVLLVILAIYDAISVYKTKHMVDLADKVVDWHLPILLVIPKTWSYSFIKQKGLKKQIEDGEEREAMFMGLGDIIIPGTLAISAFTFLNPISSWADLTGNFIVAIGVLIGTLFGFVALMRYVLKGNPQAGLPLLNSGAIIGYLITYYLVYQDLSFGVSLVF